MLSRESAQASLAEALNAASDAFAQENPKSEEVYKQSFGFTPGGTTRNVLSMKPFPVVMASGDGAYLTDVDGHRYLDLCSEYSAGMFGHSHPVITKAMHGAIDAGIALGSVNQYEGKLARLLCERFSSIDSVRFSNSGTEANMTCLALIRAYRSKNTFLVFRGGYHGGLVAFHNEKENNMSATGPKTMNVPHKFVVAPYNDAAAMAALADEHREDLAGIMLELMQGSSGCIPADVDFIRACRAKATETGAVLVFDEVMTSRMSVGGYQSLLKIYPDMTTLGKYLAGGGCNFGAFGGKAEIMGLLEPGRPDGAYHSGTYNNNVQTMATAIATLEELWTPEVATALWNEGVWLRQELNALSASMHSSLHVSGTGSLMTIHFTGKEVHNAADAQAGNTTLKELFFLDMIKRGFFLARRGMVSLMSVHTREDLLSFVAAVRGFLEDFNEYTSTE